MSRKRFLYILSLDGSPNVCKIGISVNPKQRSKTLQTGSPDKISVIRAWAFDDLYDAKHSETAMHSALSEYQKIGEWFSISPEKAIQVFFSVRQIFREKDYHPDDFEELCKMTAHQAIEEVAR